MNTKPVYKSPAGKRAILARYDEFLARWPVPYETATIPTRHGETFVIASGEKSAPPLVLLHGSASNAVSWGGDVLEYSRHFRVYAVDLPGEPGRSSENRPSWHNLDFAEWLEDVLDGLAVPTASLLGISQGGWTAIRFAAIHPQRVDRLVLLTPVGIVPMRISILLKGMLFAAFGKWAGAAGLGRLFGDQPVHPEVAEFLQIIRDNFNIRIEKGYLFSDDELKRLAMPTLFIGGAQEMFFDIEKAARRLRGLVPQFSASILEGMGHALIGLAPQIVPFLLDPSCYFRKEVHQE
ncbi:MAG: alpha/beta fold hydrolase [Chloroflexota bacterium]